jgi:hypothetical protein
VTGNGDGRQPRGCRAQIRLIARIGVGVAERLDEKLLVGFAVDAKQTIAAAMYGCDGFGAERCRFARTFNARWSPILPSAIAVSFCSGPSRPTIPTSVSKAYLALKSPRASITAVRKKSCPRPASRISAARTRVP